MAKNSEVYKTEKERAEAFLKAWKSDKDSYACYMMDEFIKWLDLEVEEEQPLPCPFCGGEAKETANFGGVHFVMCDCGYSSTETSDKESAIAAHNRVAKKCMEVKE